MPDILIKCGTCGAVLDEEDLFCPNCGTESPSREGEAAAAAHLTTHNFICRGCGASMSYDASAGTLRCPFCGSTQLEKQADAKEIAPQAVVPFVITQEQAIAAMRQWLGNGFWRPGDLSQQAAIVKMTPVYVPYWVFQAQTHTFWTADTNRTPPGARASWYPVTGTHEGTYNALLVGASGALEPAETAALCPFDLSTAAPPDKIDLTNSIYERFTVPRKYARPLASQGFEQLESQACQQYVPGLVAKLEGQCPDHRFDEPADARAGLDHGLPLSESCVPLPGERANGPRYRAGSDILAEDRRRDSPRHACAIDPVGNCRPRGTLTRRVSEDAKLHFLANASG